MKTLSKPCITFWKESLFTIFIYTILYLLGVFILSFVIPMINNESIATKSNYMYMLCILLFFLILEYPFSLHRTFLSFIDLIMKNKCYESNCKIISIDDVFSTSGSKLRGIGSSICEQICGNDKIKITLENENSKKRFVLYSDTSFLASLEKDILRKETLSTIHPVNIHDYDLQMDSVIYLRSSKIITAYDWQIPYLH